MGGDSGHRSGTNHQEGSGAWDYSAKSARTGLGISCPLGCCIAEGPRHPPQSAIKSADATLPLRVSYRKRVGMAADEKLVSPVTPDTALNHLSGARARRRCRG